MSKKKDVTLDSLVKVKPITDNQKLVFEEYNRWSYKWNPITFPLSKKQEEGLGEMENENGEANQDM